MEKPSFDNIAIRPYVLGDIPRLYDATIESIDILAPWFPWCQRSTYSIKDTQAWVTDQTSAFLRNEAYGFAIVDKQDRLLGSCCINNINRSHKYGIITYWTRLSCAGSGVATKSVRLLVDWAFKNTGLHRIEILCAVENKAGRRVTEKAGATFVGIMEKRLCLRDGMHDAAMYAFLRP